MSDSHQHVEFKGGLDIVTPPLSMSPGKLRESQNYEIGEFGGYRMVGGYERFDGRPSPSDAQYTVLACTFSGSISVGNTITGVTSAATGYVIAVASTYVAFTKGTGTFVSGEVLNVGGSPQATTTADPIVDGASTSLLRGQYKNLAADAYRSDILAVPGSGAILGFKYLGSTLYAWRNNAGGTAAAIYKSSVTGWTAVSLSEEISFSNANTSVGEGDVLTQGAVTATISRVMVETGTLLSGVNTGRLIITSRAGGNYGAGAATSTGGGALTLSAIQTTITLLPNGRYRFYNNNFGSGLRIYGCDGVNRGFEFDGTVFAPIRTGMTSDTPDHVACHKNHLFFAFDNSLQHSSIGAPYAWSPVMGASELNMGDTVTNLLPQTSDSVAGGSMACFTRGRTFMLYGTSSANWSLVTLQQDAGALEDTAQIIGQTYVLDDRGITNLATTQNFGNFAAAAVSDAIRPWLVERKDAVQDSCVVHEKNQYRLFFSGGSALYMTMVKNKISGFMPMTFPDNIQLAASVEKADGSEIVFYADDAGFVYQADKGTSFDGDDIESYMTLVFNHAASPRTLKQYRKAVLEVGGSGYANFYLSADLGYASTDLNQPTLALVETALESGAWDSGTWDVGIWDGRILQPAEHEIVGIAENIGLRIAQSSDYFAQLTFYGAVMQFAPRRQMR